MRFRWVRFHIEISKVTRPNFTGLVSPNAGRIVVDKILFYPILNILIRFGDIRRRTSKSSEIGLNFACFWPLKFFRSVLSKIFNRHYKIGSSTDHLEKFYAGRPTHLGDFAQEKN